MEKRIPRRRFKEFVDSGDWEEKKLGEVAEKITKGTTPIDKSWIGPINYIKTESIDKDSGNLRRISSTSIKEHEGYLKRSQLKAGDILFSIVGTLGRVGVVKNKDLPANTNQQISIIRVNNIDTLFLVNYLKSPSIKQFIDSERTIGAQPSISLWQINKLNIPIPSLAEQEKIGDFFQGLDRLIDINRQKLEKLKASKSAYLTEMFPREGEDRPRRRFKGFTGPWEEKKLGDVAEINSGKDYKGLSIGNIPVYGTGGYMLSVDKALSYYEDAIGIGRKGTIDRPYILKAPFWTVDTLFYVTFKVGNNLNFMFGLFQNINWKNMDESSGVPSLSSKSIKNINILIPSLAEQEKIGNFFQKLDQEIGLQEEKLGKLEDLKKAYLAEMFV